MKICTIDIDNKGLIETIEFHQEEIRRIDKWIAIRRKEIEDLEKMDKSINEKYEASKYVKDRIAQSIEYWEGLIESDKLKKLSLEVNIRTMQNELKYRGL